MSGQQGPRLKFTRAMRMTQARQYQRVYAARTSVTRGPLRIHACPSLDGKARLGLSVPGRVGTNVVRNRIKRLLREAFRLRKVEIAEAIAAGPGLEIVVGVQPHEPAALEDYTKALVSAIAALAKTWRARQK